MSLLGLEGAIAIYWVEIGDVSISSNAQGIVWFKVLAVLRLRSPDVGKARMPWSQTRLTHQHAENKTEKSALGASLLLGEDRQRE